MINRVTFVLVVLTNLARADQVAPPPAQQPAAGAPRTPVAHQAPDRQGPRPKPDDMEIFGEPMPRRPLPPPPPPPVVAPPEVAKLGKQLVGRYKCKGVTLKGDGSSTPLEASYVLKLELESAWVAGEFVEAKAGGVKFDDYRTFDVTAKQWTRIRMHSTSAHVIESTLGEKDGKWTWEGSSVAPTGTTQVRDFEQPSGKQIKLWGEALLGGTWQKAYEATCKR